MLLSAFSLLLRKFWRMDQEGTSTVARAAASKRIFVTFIQSTNLIAVKALFPDLHPSAKCPDSGKFFNRKANCFRCSSKATILCRCSAGITLALRDEQLSRQVVVERHSRSQYPFEFVFLDNPIKRLVSTLNAISVFTVLGGQVLYDLDVARTSPTEGSGRVVYRLPDLEFVVTHVITEPLLPRHGIMKRFSKSDLYGSGLSPSGVAG